VIRTGEVDPGVWTTGRESSISRPGKMGLGLGCWAGSTVLRA